VALKYRRRVIYPALLLALSALTARVEAQSDPRPEAGVTVMGEAGWRYMFAGQRRIVRDDEAFLQGFHGGASMFAGPHAGGFYASGRFDGFAPTGLGTFPFVAQARLGMYFHFRRFDDGIRSHTNTDVDCWAALGVCRVTETTSTRRVAPPMWYQGLEYVYVGGRWVDGTESDADALGNTRRTNAQAVTLGIGILEPRGNVTVLVEMEAQRYVRGFRERSLWGGSLRGGLIFGPAFLDATILLDAAVGGEISVGAGMFLRSR
jgi:hypothetical protein